MTGERRAPGQPRGGQSAVVRITCGTYSRRWWKVVEGGGRRWKVVEGGGRWWKVAEGGARWGKVGQGGGRWSFKLSGGKLSGGKLSGGTLSGGTPFQARRAGCCCTA